MDDITFKSEFTFSLDIYETVEKFLLSINPHLRHEANIHSGHVSIQMPQFFIDMWADEIERKAGTNPIPEKHKNKNRFHYLGMPIYPHHKMEVVVFHRDFALYNSDWMCETFSLLKK